ncbi:telomeric DNA binding protein [Panus rudis PR-1116 ss-1]|nr:telomeric DNA binding protein [Panus rudis PR-1116 ss-1]
MPQSEYDEITLTQIRETISRLQAPIPDLSTLLALLSGALDTIGLLPPRFLRYNSLPLSKGAVNVSKHVPILQRALLEHVIPTWEQALKEEHAYELVEQYFCPDSFSFSTPYAAEIALHAYSTILSLPLTEYSLQFFVRLSKSYPIDVLWTTIFRGSRSVVENRELTWQDYVRNIASIPVKVANSLDHLPTIPPELEVGNYFSNMSRRCEVLIHNLSGNYSKADLDSIGYLFTKLVNIGLFPATKPTLPSQASFFQSSVAQIRDHLDESPKYCVIWSDIISSIPSTLTQQAIVMSLFAHLNRIDDLDTSSKVRYSVKCEAQLVAGVIGQLSPDRSDIWDAVKAVVVRREWSVGHARIFVCCVASCGPDTTRVKALERFLDDVVELWTTADHVKHSLLKHHHYVTALLLLTLSYLSAPEVVNLSSAVKSLAFSPAFVQSISVYLNHMDPSVRRCGMLVAEEVARIAGKNLDFGTWEGDSDGRTWCRAVRELMKERDADAVLVEDTDTQEYIAGEKKSSYPKIDEAEELDVPKPRKPMIEDVTGYDSDDSITGYASQPSSSRSPSPTPSELEEIEKDPTLRVTQKKIARPVYLAQLGEMVRPTGGLKTNDEEDEARKHEVALDVAEELIRRKRDYGTELEENAVNLAYGLISLQDTYELGGFNEKRQAALVALIACCPKKAAPALIEEFFKNQFSTEQRYAILNALALGARELASLSGPETAASRTANSKRIAFPSKQLPPALHQKYLAASSNSSQLMPVRNLLDGISQAAIDRGRDASADKVPQLVRERQLRIKQPQKISEVTPDASLQKLKSSQIQPRPTTTFTDVAAEYFLCPLINRFWLFLRDEQTREARTAHQSVLHRYRGAGTGLILNALVLSHFMGTLAVLVHASLHAKEWLAVIAPDALELAVTLGTRPLSLSEEDDDPEDETNGDHATKRGKEAAVLTSALELALIVLDGCVERDGGRSISLEHTTLVLAANEWAEKVLERMEEGEKVLGGGGVHEVKLKRAAAGVVLKADEITSRWKRSMVNVLSYT